MGCCMSSTPKTGSRQPKAAPSLPPPPPPPSQHRCPPKPHKTLAPKPASLEEETVKEVLSETTTITRPKLQKNTQIPIVQQTEAKDRNFVTQQSKEEEKERTPEISQASEICSSVTDTLSAATTATTATTTVTEIREDEATSKKRVLRSPSKVPRKRLYTGDRERVSRSPASKERLPMKRELSGQMMRTAQRNVGSSRVRRDGLGEGSGRRPRSPATRTGGGVGRGRGVGSPAKVTGKAGGRSTGVGAATRRMKQGQGNDGALMEQQQQGNESLLENPLVSLECFIFL